MKTKLILAASIITFFFTSCQEEKEPPRFSQVQMFDIDNGIVSTQSYMESPDAHSGKKFSRADVGNNFGFGYTYILPDSIKGKDIIVELDAWVRTGDLSNKCDFAISAISRDSALMWVTCGAKDVMKAPGVWSNIISHVEIPSSITTRNDLKINLLAHNVDAKSYFDVDDVVFRVFEKPTEKEE